MNTAPCATVGVDFAEVGRRTAEALHGKADRAIREAATEHGFENADDYRVWQRLDGMRRVALGQRTAQRACELSDGEAKVFNRLAKFVGRGIASQVLRLGTARARGARKLLNITESHDSSPSVGGVVAPTVGGSPSSPSPAVPSVGDGALSSSNGGAA